MNLELNYRNYICYEKVFLYLFLFCLISACNTTTQGAYNNYDFIQGGPVPLKVETEEEINLTGECLADTLIFL